MEGTRSIPRTPFGGREGGRDGGWYRLVVKGVRLDKVVRYSLRIDKYL